jgi:16S rRNA processing protein RimM
MRKRRNATESTPQDSPPTQERDGMVALGRIGAAQGLRGEVRIATFTEAPENIAAYGPLTGGNGRMFRITALRPLKGAVVVARLEGVADRNTAEALAGIELSVARACMPPADDGEWYYGDLIGLRAVAPDGAELGEIIAVLNHGAGDLLEVRVGDAAQTLLVSFTEAAVPTVDVAAGCVVVVLPEEIDAGAPDEDATE